MRWCCINLVFVIFALLVVMASGARARVAYAPYASIVIDASSDRIMQHYRADQKRHPASLTKLMTLYILFEEIEAGRIKADTPIPVSAQAADQPASRLGLTRGSYIDARTAMKALLIKSANDVAVALAEHIAGSEVKFAHRMSLMARRLGMHDTHFVNASGLYHWRQQTTARDMAHLSKILLERFPQFETLWNLQSFVYRGKRHTSHNHLLQRLPGSLGMKTGYIRASGYNITTAIERDGRRIIIVVIGGKSAKQRDRQVMLLAERSLPRAGIYQTRNTPNALQRHAARSWLIPPSGNAVMARQRAKTTGLRDWQIQVGAFNASRLARSHLQRVRRVVGENLQAAEGRTERIELGGQQIFRARFANLSESQAFSICQQLENIKPGCLPIKP